MKQLAFISMLWAGLVFAIPAWAQDDDMFGEDDEEEFEDEEEEEEETEEEDEAEEDEDEEDEDEEEDEEEDDDSSEGGSFGEDLKFLVGGGAYFGMAWAVGDFDDDDGSRPRFAGGGAILGDMYIMDMLAVTLGIGLQGQGFFYKEPEVGGDGDIKIKILYMDVPVGAKLDFNGLQVGLAIAIQFALKSKWKSDTMEEDDAGFDGYRRFNLAPRATFGYAIPLGPVLLVPSVDFAMQLLNNAVDNEDYNSNRNMNIMAGIAGYYTLPI